MTKVALVFGCVLWFVLSTTPHLYSTSRLVSQKIELRSALTGAAISPDGRYVAAVFPYAPKLSDGNRRFSEEIRVWEVSTSHQFLSREIFSRQENEHVALSHFAALSHMTYCNNGHNIAIYDPSGSVYFIASQTLKTVRVTDLHISADTTNIPSVRSKLVCTPNNTLGVIAIFDGSYGHGLVQVYDLATSALLREWDFRRTSEPFGDVALSPDGRAVAVIHLTAHPGQRPKRTRNLQIFDVDSGKLRTQIATDDLAGQVAFVGDNCVATVSIDLPRMLSKPQIKLWNLDGGILVRQFSDPERGVSQEVAASAGGKVILGYTGKDRVHFNWSGFEDVYEIQDQQFRLWDVDTGKTIATSPPLLPIEGDNIPILKLSDNGASVLTFWPRTQNPLYIFDVIPK